jgi:hypothetical protein
VLVPTLMILIGGGLMAIHLHGAAAGMVVVYGLGLYLYRPVHSYTTPKPWCTYT